MLLYPFRRYIGFRPHRPPPGEFHLSPVPVRGTPVRKVNETARSCSSVWSHMPNGASGVGIGVIPDRVFEALSEGMNLCSVRLLDSWAARELRIVVRDRDRLTTSSRLLLDHLAGARQG